MIALNKTGATPGDAEVSPPRSKRWWCSDPRNGARPVSDDDDVQLPQKPIPGNATKLVRPRPERPIQRKAFLELSFDNLDLKIGVRGHFIVV